MPDTQFDIKQDVTNLPDILHQIDFEPHITNWLRIWRHVITALGSRPVTKNTTCQNSLSFVSTFFISSQTFLKILISKIHCHIPQSPQTIQSNYKSNEISNRNPLNQEKYRKQKRKKKQKINWKLNKWNQKVRPEQKKKDFQNKIAQRLWSFQSINQSIGKLFIIRMIIKGLLF